MGVIVSFQHMERKVVGSLYLRDTNQFLLDLARQMALSLSNACVKSLSWWFRTRVEIAWSKRLTTEMHASYFQSQAYYRQQNLPNRIVDPGQRIVRDVQSMMMQMTPWLQMVISSIVNTVNSCVRLAWYID